MAPEVTVVIPTRDRRLLLRQALACVLSQEQVDLEVVVVDDGSVDDTSTWLARLADPRLKVIRHERSLGQVHARNAGIFSARGRWLAFLDDDDLWAPNKLKSQLEVAASTGARLVYSSAVELDERGQPLGIVPAIPAEELPERIKAATSIPAGGSNVLANTGVVRDLRGFDPSLAHLADWDMWIRLVAKLEIADHPEPVVAYLNHPDSFHARDLRGIWRELRYIDRKHFRGQRPGRERAGLLRWAAEGHLAGGRRLRAASTFLRAAIRYRRRRDARAAVEALFRPHFRGRGQAQTPAQGWPQWLEQLPVPLSLPTDGA